VLRSRAQNLAVRLDLDGADIETNENGGRTPLSEDHLRSIRLGGRYDLLDTLLTPAFTSVTGKISQGLDIFGASSEGAAFATRPAGDPTYTKLNMEIQRLQTLGEGFNLLLGGTGQYSFSKLLSPEEFGIGGEEYGRGFDPSEFAGDHGLAGKVELQYGGEGGALPISDWQLYGFYDFGAIWNKDPVAGDSSRHSLASTGGGVRFNVNPSLSGYIEIAKPVINRVHAVSEDEGKDPRLFLGVVGKF
jgi:hemolysin activation/secretion protein